MSVLVNDWAVDLARMASEGDVEVTAWRPKFYRVQHEADGRGPFRPGFSGTWADADGDALRRRHSAVHELWGLDLADNLRHGEVGATAVHRLDLLREWFSGGEMHRLSRIGYVVAAHGDARVVRAVPQQVFIAKKTSLALGATRMSWKRLLAG